MTTKRALILIPIIPVIIILLFASPFMIATIINNISLYSFSEQLHQYALPKNAKIVETKQVCGKLNGNGNGMDFFACILIESDLPIDDIKRHYKTNEFKPAKPIEEADFVHIVDVDVVRPTGYRLQTAYVEHVEIDFNTLRNSTDFSKYYFVMIYDGGYSALFDIRGH